MFFQCPCRLWILNEKNRRPGRAGLWHAPTTLVSGYRASGPRNGSIDNPFPVVSVEINDPNDVGARRRQARPGRPKGRKFKSRCPASGIHPPHPSESENRLFALHQQARDSWPATRDKKACIFRCRPFLLTGSSLSSRTVSSRVLSAYKGLTAVFGMGTGGSP